MKKVLSLLVILLLLDVGIAVDEAERILASERPGAPGGPRTTTTTVEAGATAGTAPSPPEAQPYVFTKKQYVQMLLSDEMNYGKLSYENHILVYGAHNYYKIIEEAIHHGFRG